MKNIKIITWWTLSLLWSPFELVYMLFTKELSKVALYLADKINFK